MTEEQFERLESHLTTLQATLVAGFATLSGLIIEAKKDNLNLETEAFHESLATGMALVGHMRETLLDDYDDCGCDDPNCSCATEKDIRF